MPSVCYITYDTIIVCAEEFGYAGSHFAYGGDSDCC